METKKGESVHHMEYIIGKATAHIHKLRHAVLRGEVQTAGDS